MDMPAAIARVIDGDSLTKGEMNAVMRLIMTGKRIRGCGRRCPCRQAR
jgi:anthranilate phosphoribosyltransferase